MTDYNKLSREDLIRLLLDRDGIDIGGIRLTYPGQPPLADHSPVETPLAAH